MFPFFVVDLIVIVVVRGCDGVVVVAFVIVVVLSIVVLVVVTIVVVVFVVVFVVVVVAVVVVVVDLYGKRKVNFTIKIDSSNISAKFNLVVLFHQCRSSK